MSLGIRLVPSVAYQASEAKKNNSNLKQLPALNFHHLLCLYRIFIVKPFDSTVREIILLLFNPIQSPPKIRLSIHVKYGSLILIVVRFR